MSAIYKKCEYNNETQQQMWLTIVGDSHDLFCSCDKPYSHLLDSIFPEGHRDRNKTIQQIIVRDNTQCLSGGPEEEDGGMPAGTSAATLKRDVKEEFTEDIRIEDLLAAAENAEQR